MKLGNLMFAAALVAPLAFGAPARSAQVMGQISLDGVALSTSPTTDIALATTFVLAINSSSPANQLELSEATGSFMPIPDGTPVNVDSGLFTTTSPYIVLSLGANSFTGTLLGTNTGGGGFRNIEIFGTINAVGFDPTDARLLLSFTQAGGPTGEISVSGTLASLAIPEPASLAMVGMGLAGLVGLARARGRRSTIA